SVSSSFVDRSRAAHALHSFPTRRSSDLLALSLSLLLAWRKRLALLPLVPVLLISLASLGEEYLGWRLGTGEWLFRHGLIVEGVMPGHMAPNSAVAWLLASLGVLLAPGRPGRADARWVASWACGLMLVVIAGTVVLGYLTELPAIRGWGSYTPMALMTGMAVLLLGLALVFAGASRQREMDTQRGVWIPVGVGLAAVALSVSLWLRFELVIAGTVVLGYLTELPAIRGWGSYTPMALMTGMAVLLLGLALVFAGASRQREMDTQRGVWIPVGVGLAAVALSVSLWLRFER